VAAARPISSPEDLADLTICRAVIGGADAEFGRLDVLVNSAAITDRGTLIDTSPELTMPCFAVNTRAPFFLMQDAAKIMIRERIEGAMVNILSMSAHGGQPFIIAYSGSKGALATLTKNAAFSLLKNRIRVNGLAIGWMDTPAEDHIQKTYHNAPDDWLARAEAEKPFGRLLKPAEVARAVAYLASEESGMMTGSIIDFDQQAMGTNESPPPRSEALAL
jgi:NAD(P)-dependent dehydrogenase (short-subunit alcohol dehydrogenase family)